MLEVAFLFAHRLCLANSLAADAGSDCPCQEARWLQQRGMVPLHSPGWPFAMQTNGHPESCPLTAQHRGHCPGSMQNSGLPKTKCHLQWRLPMFASPALVDQFGSVSSAPQSHPAHCNHCSLKTTGAVRSSCWPELLKLPGRGRWGQGESQQNFNLWVSSRANPHSFSFISYYTALC